MTACTQPRCIGTIVDDYCDVCGSPACTAPFISAAAAASAASSAAAPADQEILTQRIPRGRTLGQQVSTQEMTDPGAAAPGAVEAQRADGEKELAQDEPDRAKDYRRRVEDAQLPDKVRNAALSEVDELERTNDQNPESGDIRTWLDTILDLPWGTKTTDWIDIQGSPEVAATLRRLIEPTVADIEDGNTAEAGPVAADMEGNTAEAGPAVVDVEEGDAGEAGPAVADVEETNTAELEPVAPDVDEADTAPPGQEHDDTVKMPAVPAVHGGGQHQHAQSPKQPVLEPEPVQTPANKRRLGSLALAAIASVALLIGAYFFAASRDGSMTAQSLPTVTATAAATVSKPTSKPADKSTNTEGEKSIIQLDDLAGSARPFQPVRIHGTYRGGADTLLQVQRWDGRKWLAFPLPTRTDQAGQFTTYVELAQPGRYPLRVLDPASGVTSKTFLVGIKG
jgi:hypothetical protein